MVTVNGEGIGGGGAFEFRSIVMVDYTDFVFGAKSTNKRRKYNEYIELLYLCAVGGWLHVESVCLTSWPDVISYPSRTLYNNTAVGLIASYTSIYANDYYYGRQI